MAILERYLYVERPPGKEHPKDVAKQYVPRWCEPKIGVRKCGLVTSHPRQRVLSNGTGTGAVRQMDLFGSAANIPELGAAFISPLK
jgi:hypothetical protein